MTDAPAPEEDLSPEPIVVEQQFDAMLASLVNIVNASEENRLGVTLAIPGGMITGTLVGVRTWLKTLEEAMASNELARLTTALRENFYPTDEDLEQRDHRMVHLVDAQYVSAAGLVPTTGGFLWRGMLHQVVGWSLGTMGVSS